MTDVDFDDLRPHVHHEFQCIRYGDDPVGGVKVSCLTCGVELLNCPKASSRGDTDE